MSDDLYRQRLEALFSDSALPPAPLNDHPLEEARREIDSLRAQVAELETRANLATGQAASAQAEQDHLAAQVGELYQRATIAEKAVEIAVAELRTRLGGNQETLESRPTSLFLFEKDRVGYVYEGHTLEPLQNWLATPNLQSAITAPLIVAEQAIGGLHVEPAAQRHWTPEEKQLATAIAHQASLQIENLRLLAATERARAEAEAATRRFTREGWGTFLDAIQHGERIGYAYDQSSITPYLDNLSSGNGFQQPILVTAEQIGALYIETEAMRDLSNEDKVLVLAVARQTAQQVENLRLLADAARARTEAEAATRRLTRESWQAYGLQQGDSQTGYVYDGNQVIALDTTSPTQESTHTQPILLRGESIGQLSVTGIDSLSPDAAELAAAVATQVSAHLENLRLTGQSQKRAAELEAVAQVTSAASTTLESDKLLQAVVNLTKEAFGLYHTHIYLLDEETQTLTLAAGAGEVGQQMVAQGWKIPLAFETSLVAKAARTRAGVTVNDVRTAPDFLPNPWLPNTRSELAVPMIVGDTVLGVFDVQSEQVGRFTESDVRIQTTLAAQVAIALQNARLFAEQAETAEHLRDIDKLKSAFLANMSHELRTPLNSIIGFTDVILEGLDGPLTQRQAHDLQLVHNNGLHLLNLITDILDMAKIEAGKLNLSLEPFNLYDVLREVIDTTSPLARNKHVQVQIDITEPRLDVEADRLRIRQVLINLINNAIKFSESGGVITVRGLRANGRLSVSVSDTGIGVPADHLEGIFKEFHQIDTSTTRRVGGTGLGLPISRHLIELHGGRLWAESDGVRGKGSTFTFEVPVESRVQS